MAEWIIAAFTVAGTTGVLLGMLFHWVRNTEHRQTTLEGRVVSLENRCDRMEKDARDSSGHVIQRLDYLETLKRNRPWRQD